MLNKDLHYVTLHYITLQILKNVYLLQTELIGITNRERKPPLKGDTVPSIFSYVPEKTVLQALNAAIHQSRLPRHDRVVSSAIASTASGRFWAMFESLLSWRRCRAMAQTQTDAQHHLIQFLTQATSRYCLQCHGCLPPPSSTVWPMWCHSLAFIRWKQNGSQEKQNGNFVAPIICYKVDYRANYCYFQLLFHSMNFHLR